jgi:AcrR family transcriptional regulator
MGTSDRIERERQAKRALILEAARELFLERGYAAVTLRSVAERIEHSTTAVYVHFKDKRDLVEQMVAEDFQQFDTALLATASVQPALARLERLGTAYIDFALRLPRHYQLLFMTPRPDGVAKSMQEADDADRSPRGPEKMSGFELLLSTVQACIAEGAFHPAYRDPLAIAQSVWAGVHGLVSLLIIMGKEPHFQWRSPALLHQTLVGSMLRGLQLEPPPGAAAAMDAAPLYEGDVGQVCWDVPAAAVGSASGAGGLRAGASGAGAGAAGAAGAAAAGSGRSGPANAAGSAGATPANAAGSAGSAGATPANAAGSAGAAGAKAAEEPDGGDPPQSPRPPRRAVPKARRRATR